MKAQSKGRQAELAVLERARRDVLARDGHRCQAPTGTGALRCDRGLVVHHISGRSGPEPHDPENLVTLCRVHHDWVHAHPDEARVLGLYGSRA